MEPNHERHCLPFFIKQRKTHRGGVLYGTEQLNGQLPSTLAPSNMVGFTS
jgi:hypothetical protein